MRKKILSQLLVVTASVLLLLMGVYAFADWTAPVAVPPTCASGSPGCDAPLHVGLTGQVKNGGLTVAANSAVANGLRVLFGNVGIGTDTPVALLSLHKPTSSDVIFQLTNSVTGVGTGDGTVFLLAEGASSKFSITQHESAPIQFNQLVGGAGGTVNPVLTIHPFAGNVGIGDTTPFSLFTVGDLDLFQVNSSGDLVRIKNVPYVWPSANAAGVLTSDVSGNLSWAAGLPTGISGQTLRHDGTSWTANSVLFNNGTNVGIGTTAPGANAKLEVNGGVKLNTVTAKPACDSSARGTIWFTQSAAGVSDLVEACVRNSAGAYVWRALI